MVPYGALCRNGVGKLWPLVQYTKLLVKKGNFKLQKSWIIFINFYFFSGKFAMWRRRKNTKRRKLYGTIKCMQENDQFGKFFNFQIRSIENNICNKNFFLNNFFLKTGLNILDWFFFKGITTWSYTVQNTALTQHTRFLLTFFWKKNSLLGLTQK